MEAGAASRTTPPRSSSSSIRPGEGVQPAPRTAPLLPVIACRRTRFKRCRSCAMREWGGEVCVYVLVLVFVCGGNP